MRERETGGRERENGSGAEQKGTGLRAHLILVRRAKMKWRAGESQTAIYQGLCLVRLKNCRDQVTGQMKGDEL